MHPTAEIYAEYLSEQATVLYLHYYDIMTRIIAICATQFRQNFDKQSVAIDSWT